MEENKNQPEKERKPGYLKPQLNKLEADFSNDLWSRINGNIPKKQKRRFLIWWWFSGLIILSLGLAASYFTRNSQLENDKIRLAQKQEKVLHRKNDLKSDHTFKNKESGKQRNQKNEQNLLSRKPIEGKSNHVNDLKTKPGELLDSQKINSGLDKNYIARSQNRAEKIRKGPAISGVETETNKSNIKKGKGKGNTIAQSKKLNTGQGKITGSSNFTDKYNKNNIVSNAENDSRKKTGPHSNKNRVKLAENEIRHDIIDNQKINDLANENMKENKNTPNSIGSESTSKTDSILSLPITVSNPVPKIPKRDSNRVQKNDSVKVVDIKSDSIHKKMKGKHIWSLEVGVGSLFQVTKISDYNSNVYNALNSESNLRFQKNKAKPTAVVLLQGNRLWAVWRNFHAGIRLRAGLAYQEIETDLLSGKYSASSFSYGPDSLSFFATTNAETGGQLFRRTTFFADAGLLLRYKRIDFPIGIGINFPFARIQHARSGPESTNGNTIQYFLRLPDIRIWYGIMPNVDIFAESLNINWGNFALPLPVENKGKNLGVQFGFAWHW